MDAKVGANEPPLGSAKRLGFTSFIARVAAASSFTYRKREGKRKRKWFMAKRLDFTSFIARVADASSFLYMYCV